jgi:hypothetical protein
VARFGGLRHVYDLELGASTYFRKAAAFICPLAFGLAGQAKPPDYFSYRTTKRLFKCTVNFDGRWGWRWKVASYIHGYREIKALAVGQIPKATLNVTPAFLLILTGELIWKASPQ